MRILVTGFGPFGSVVDNPSAHLARGVSADAVVLEVSFAAVDRLIATLDPADFDAWLMLGFSAQASKLVIERSAANRVGLDPDVLGASRPGPVEEDGPERLKGTLWPAYLSWTPCNAWRFSDDAGSYLCNYLYYRGVHRFPDRKVGLVHVPGFGRMSDQHQIEGLRALVRRCEQGSIPPGRPAS